MVDIARAIAFMAGAEGEIAFLGENVADGDSYDREEIELVAEEMNSLPKSGAPDCAPKWVEARLRSWTRTLCRRHAHRVKAVADALLQEGTLINARARRLMGVEKRLALAV